MRTRHLDDPCTPGCSDCVWGGVSKDEHRNVYFHTPAEERTDTLDAIARRLADRLADPTGPITDVR